MPVVEIFQSGQTSTAIRRATPAAEHVHKRKQDHKLTHCLSSWRFQLQVCSFSFTFILYLDIVKWFTLLLLLDGPQRFLLILTLSLLSSLLVYFSFFCGFFHSSVFNLLQLQNQVWDFACFRSIAAPSACLFPRCIHSPMRKTVYMRLPLSQ